MISGDPAILDPNSAVGKRAEEYRKIFGELDILLCFGTIASFISGFRRGYTMMSKKDFDVITAQSPEHWLLAWIFSLIFRIPWQIQIHVDIFSPYFWRESLKNKLRVGLVKFLLPKADGIRVVSERIKQSLVSDIGCQVSRIVVLPVFVNAQKIQSAKVKVNLRQKYSNYDFIILMASRLTKEKNIGLAVGAMKELLQNADNRNQQSASSAYNQHHRHYNPLLLIVGEGPEQKNIQLLITDYQLQNNVIIEPWSKDLVSYYKTVDLFLLTSNYEGYGRTVVEAMAAGLSVIMTDVGLAGELLIDDLDGLVIPVGDTKALAENIKNLINNPGKKDAMIKESFELINSLSSKEEYLRLYKEGLMSLVK